MRRSVRWHVALSKWHNDRVVWRNGLHYTMQPCNGSWCRYGVGRTFHMIVALPHRYTPTTIRCCSMLCCWATGRCWSPWMARHGNSCVAALLHVQNARRPNASYWGHDNIKSCEDVRPIANCARLVVEKISMQINEMTLSAFDCKLFFSHIINQPPHTIIILISQSVRTLLYTDGINSYQSHIYIV